MRKAGAFEIKLGRRLQDERFRLGYTLREVAARTGLSSTAICQIENGVRSPKFKTVALLSRFYEVTLDHWLS
jgi:transcriptional regulator with XRE-family HTH domain